MNNWSKINYVCPKCGFTFWIEWGSNDSTPKIIMCWRCKQAYSFDFSVEYPTVVPVSDVEGDIP